MSSVTAPISLYNLCSGTLNQVKTYRKGSAMNYIYKLSPLFAVILQRADADDWFESLNFNCTCFIPNREYSSRYLNYFLEIDYQTARAIVQSSVIIGQLSEDILTKKEIIPTIGKYYRVHIEAAEDSILVNKMHIETKVNADNGVIFILNGLLHPTCSR